MVVADQLEDPERTWYYFDIKNARRTLKEILGRG